MIRHSLLQMLKQFDASTKDQKETKDKFIGFVEVNQTCFERTLSIGHVTASGLIVDRKKNAVLLLHHKKLNRWLQPGGHCDGDSDTVAVAEKEVYEETGLALKVATPFIHDLDIHTIPSWQNTAEHEHYDVRYIFEYTSSDSFVKNHESNQLKWIELGELKNYDIEPSIVRMINKAFGTNLK
jgi:8-oxo-dGTP pyrophosphatase MutT (NUDIX family)